MNGEIQSLGKNMRYNAIIINEEYYILDKEQRMLIYFIPFLFWVLPNRLYKIGSKEVLEQIKRSNKPKNGYFSIFVFGFSLLLANLLRPIMQYFNTELTSFITYLLIFLIFVIAILLRFQLRSLNRINMNKAGETHLAIVRPKSVIYIFKFVFSYLFFLLFLVLFIITFTTTGNMMMLLFSMFLIFALLIINNAVVAPGIVKIKKVKIKR
ncbi:DUF443 family protein [Virgibacillus halodenitrificans]|uniref:DUF443 family protein n=1 Tax=Virgibacillus halodenitrificans TaxID=1482 RepID=UPI000EF5016E|nr:DUF443 family protein [Virgibacillus halodenitrificans]